MHVPGFVAWRALLDQEAAHFVVFTLDRKSTRLNSSHSQISYAVFCLKKKNVQRLSQAPLVATHSNAHALCPASRNLTDLQLDAIRDSGGVVGVNFAVTFLREDGRNDPGTPITEIVRHVDYLSERMGIDHVAFGSDFDGARVPDELGGVAGLPKLVAALRDAGYDDDAVAKITHRNWLRVLRRLWRCSATTSVA